MQKLKIIKRKFDTIYGGFDEMGFCFVRNSTIILSAQAHLKCDIHLPLYIGNSTAIIFRVGNQFLIIKLRYDSTYYK